MTTYKSPFPYFGGKSLAASAIWEALGNVPNYVEPFVGSMAIPLGRPHQPKIETVNDKCGYIANFWRALQSDPDGVAHHADYPVSECDLHARHIYLLNYRDELPIRLMGNPCYYDSMIAGWWVWGMACWIGGGFCSGNGPWGSVDGKLVHLGDAGRGVSRKLVHLGDEGQGVARKLVHLGTAGRGVSRRRVHLGSAGQEVTRIGIGEGGLLGWMRALADRIRLMRVCCGDWQRVLGPSVTEHHGMTGIVLDPPYLQSEREANLYTYDENISAEVCAWALANGDNPKLRIVLCGYEGEHVMPESWRAVEWKASHGMAGKDNENRKRERLWLSPHCLASWEWKQSELFG